MNVVFGALIVVVACAVTITAMLLVRRRAPEGSYFSDGDRASGVFGVLASGFAILLGFMIFLAFQSYDESRSGAETEATLVVQQVETAQFLPKGAATEFTGELVFYGRSVAGIEWDAIDTGTLGKRSTHSGGRCSARSDRGRVHARTTRPPRLDAPTDCRTSGSRTSRPGRGRSCARHPASHDQTSTALREAIMSSPSRLTSSPGARPR